MDTFSYYKMEDGIIYKTINCKEEWLGVYMLYKDDFLHDAPIPRLIFNGKPPEISRDDFAKQMKMANGPKVVAIDKLSGKVVGAKLALAIERDSHTDDHFSMAKEHHKIKDGREEEFMNQLSLFMSLVNDYSGVFDKHPTAHRICRSMFTSVDRDFRGQQIATRLNSAAIEVARSDNFNLMMVCPTNPTLISTFTKLGYQEFKRVAWHDFKVKQGIVASKDLLEKEAINFLLKL